MSLVTWSHVTEDIVMAWNKQAGSMKTPGRLAVLKEQKHPRCHAQQSTSSRGLRGCGTGHAQPWATHHHHHPDEWQVSLCASQGAHSLLPPARA